MDDAVTILPPRPCAIMARAPALIHKWVPRTFRLSMRSKSSALAIWFREKSSPKHQMGHILTVDKRLGKTSACVCYHLYCPVKNQNTSRDQAGQEDVRTTSRLPRPRTVSSTMRCTSVSRVMSPVVTIALISGLRPVKSLFRSLSKRTLEGKSFKAIL